MRQRKRSCQFSNREQSVSSIIGTYVCNPPYWKQYSEYLLVPSSVHGSPPRHPWSFVLSLYSWRQTHLRRRRGIKTGHLSDRRLVSRKYDTIQYFVLWSFLRSGCHASRPAPAHGHTASYMNATLSFDVFRAFYFLFSQPISTFQTGDPFA